MPVIVPGDARGGQGRPPHAVVLQPALCCVELLAPIPRAVRDEPDGTVLVRLVYVRKGGRDKRTPEGDRLFAVDRELRVVR